MKTLQDIKLKLSLLKPMLEKLYAVSELGLFGSYVRNEQNDQSDLDILVDFKNPIGIEFVDLAELLEKELNLKVDLVSRNGIKPKYFSAIEPEIVYV
jgi:predicted nucleotidyltransferase